MIKQPSRDELKKSIPNDKATAKKEGITNQSRSNKSNNIFEDLLWMQKKDNIGKNANSAERRVGV